MSASPVLASGAGRFLSPKTLAEEAVAQVAHHGCRVGQIVYVARLLVGPSWSNLPVPRGESETFDRATRRAQRERSTRPGRTRPDPGGGAPPP